MRRSTRKARESGQRTVGGDGGLRHGDRGGATTADTETTNEVDRPPDSLVRTHADELCKHGSRWRVEKTMSQG